MSLQVRARAELERRRRGRERPEDAAPPRSFRDFIAAANPRYIREYKHTEVLIAFLQRVADGEIKRAMVFLPPRHSKSETISRLFSGYCLERFPEKFVGLCSYAAELAYTLSRAARENYTNAGGIVKYDAAAVKHWETPHGGGLWAAGVGGPITGKGFGSVGIIDDPLKNAEEAASEVIRAKQKEWYASTFYTRAEPGAAILVVQTRWHEDDLSGWLLDQESGESPERWHVLNLPATAEVEGPHFPASCTVLEDWRAPGEALCPERYDAERLAKIRGTLGEYYWGALYQQRPRPKDGLLFKWSRFQTIGAAPAGGERVRYWDTAGTEGGGDFTVGCLMVKAPDGRFYIEDVRRGQWSPHRKEQEIVDSAAGDARKYGRNGVSIWLEHEAGIGGKERTQTVIQKLAGYKVAAEHISGTKLSRAEPLASQVEAGNVYLVDGDWSGEFRKELCDFPHGKHDDQVDAASGAFNKLVLREDRRARTFVHRV